MKKRFWWLISSAILVIIVAVGIRTCRSPDFSFDEPTEDISESLPGLTLRDVTLEQQDENGRLLWKVDAEEVTYSPDQEVANLVNPEGELYQDGQLLYRVKADKGIIRNNGQTVFLEDNIVATGIQNQMVIKGQNLQWTPASNVLIVRNGLTGTHPQVRAKADEARVYDREQRMELEGDVVATTVVANPQTEPWLKLQGEALEWQWEQRTLDSNRPIRVERFQNGQITEVLTGQNGLVELAENQVTLTDAVKAQLLEIPLVMTTDKAVWAVDEQRIRAEEAVRVVNDQQKITVTARQGEFDLAKQVAYFNQDVLAAGDRKDSRLTANQLTWNLVDQTVLAEGNVNYQQSEPQLNIRGPRARGRIEEQTVVMDGGQVVTEIEPNF